MKQDSVSASRIYQELNISSPQIVQSGSAQENVTKRQRHVHVLAMGAVITNLASVNALLDSKGIHVHSFPQEIQWR